MNKITPFLWLDGRVEEAVTFYASIFPHAKVGDLMRRGGEVFSATFELEGQSFMALAGRPKDIQFTDAISFFVQCETQKEIDHYWNALTAGGKESRCGWLKDRYGVSWQIIPSSLGRLLGDPDPVKAQRAMQAMLKMQKLDIAALEAAHRG